MHILTLSLFRSRFVIAVTSTTPSLFPSFLYLDSRFLSLDRSLIQFSISLSLSRSLNRSIFLRSLSLIILSQFFFDYVFFTLLAQWLIHSLSLSFDRSPVQFILFLTLLIAHSPFRSLPESFTHFLFLSQSLTNSLALSRSLILWLSLSLSRRKVHILRSRSINSSFFPAMQISYFLFFFALL